MNLSHDKQKPMINRYYNTTTVDSTNLVAQNPRVKNIKIKIQKMQAIGALF